jgi:hypothetical protein
MVTVLPCYSQWKTGNFAHVIHSYSKDSTRTSYISLHMLVHEIKLSLRDRKVTPLHCVFSLVLEVPIIIDFQESQ